MSKIEAAIIGTGNIGTDLMIKLMRNSDVLELAAFVGIDPDSDGLRRAEKLGVPVTAKGIDGLREMPDYGDIAVVFDATSAKAHAHHNKLLTGDGKRVIDLTPAAIGPYVVPPVNMSAHLEAPNLNMVTCGGQATIPIVAAVSRVAPVPYAEIVASISSKSAGPGTRANIDEFTDTTSRAICEVGGAKEGKAIIILNPAEPPLVMRDTVYCLAQTDDAEAIRVSVRQMVDAVQAYVPGYRLKQEVQFEKLGPNDLAGIPGSPTEGGLKVSVFLEVEGAGHYLPKYAGNLDIMTSAALATGEQIASLQEKALQ